MTNKLGISILVVLVLVAGGFGYYAFYLNSQISDIRDDISILSNELSTFRQETAAEISDIESDVSILSTDLTTFRSETASRFDDVTDEISDVKGDIKAVGGDLTAFKSETASQIAGVTTEISRSTINVSGIYDSAIRGVCEITDGQEWFGSGFVFGAEGYIITAQHVIDGLPRIDVILYDGTISSASVVGGCKYSDVAVLELEKPVTLEPVTLADSSTVTPGDPVMALGSPFYLPGTVTSGIVSHTNGATSYAGNWLTSNLIQYDAATNYGNSGGALINSQGEIVGMIAARIHPELGEGIYWAVSSNKVNRVATSIIESGSFQNATLPGTWELSNLTPEAAGDRDMETTNGLLFVEVEGLNTVEADDILVAVDDVPVREGADLFNYLGQYKSPGDTVTLTVVIRSGVQIEVSVELVEGWVTVD